MTRFTAVAIVVISIQTALPAEPKVERTTIRYDVGDLIYRPGGKSGFDSLDEIVKSIVTTVNPKSWKLDGDDNQIFEVNGNRLEIRAGKDDHAAIKELLEAMRRLNDLAVDVTASFLAVEPKLFEKKIQPLVGKPLKNGDEESSLEEMNWKLQTIQSNSTRLANGREAPIASIQQVSASHRQAMNGMIEWHTAKVGVSYRAKAVVSADRRFVNLTVEETFQELDGLPLADTAPKLKQKKETTTVRLADGVATVLKVP